MTECPYCGHRLRKRAPKLEREGDEIRVHRSKREKRRRARAERSTARTIDLDGRPVATALTILAGALILIVGRSVPLSLDGTGAIVGPVGSEAWRYVSAPFVYDDVGAFLVLATAIGVFGASIERRLGSLATAILILATGTLGMLAASAASSGGLTDVLVAAGGNGVALGLLGAWLMLWHAEAKTHFSEPLDTIGVTVAAVVLLLIPAFEITADPIAGLGGGVVGLGMGWLAARRGAPGPG